MIKVKEVIVFSQQGDPALIKTWSNVPYFLVKHLQLNEILVHTVDLSITSIVQKIFRRCFDLITLKIFGSKNIDYTRTYFYQTYIKSKIKAEIKKYPNSDLFIFTTFSVSAKGISNKPSVLFCDWTIAHYISYFQERSPSVLEKIIINGQNKVLELADLVIVLFPAEAKRMKESLKNPNVFYIGNVINNLITSREESIPIKRASRKLLFIGSNKYLSGAVELIAAHQALRIQYSDLELHIVGLQNTDLPLVPPGVTLYGYLDKGNSDQAKVYYKLLSSAQIFVNTTPKWASFSASIEAMYFYTPVIVEQYEEFVETFGENINFGSYYNSKREPLQTTINSLLSTKDFEKICQNAHHAVKEFTWEQYVQTMLRLCSTLDAKSQIAST